MIRRWLGCAAVRLYPEEIREASGRELIGTLFDAGDASLRAFIVELASLICAALAAQSRRALAVPAQTLIFESLCWGAVVNVARVFVGATCTHIQWGGALGSPTTIATFYLLPALFLAAFTARRRRLAGMLGLLYVAAELHMHELRFLLDGLFLRASPGELLLPIVGSLLMIVAPRRTPTSASWLWLLPAAVWTTFELAMLGPYFGPGRFAPVLIVLLLSPFEPALVLGTALVWTLLASDYSFQDGTVMLTIELLCCAPVALLLLALCRRVAVRPQGR